MGRQVRPIVLLTDFGLTDHYVGVMKGVIHSLHPQAQIIDLCHDIRPQDIAAAQITLRNAAPYFPRHSIFVSVIDPGVGTERAIIGVEANDRIFLAPDNGILGFLEKEESIRNIFQITKKSFFRSPVSKTFHGRDIFSPVAAHLAAGTPLSQFGPRRNSLKSFHVPEPEVSSREILGEVISIDRFGNLVTNISAKLLPEGPLTISAGKKTIQGLSRSYADKKKKQLLALTGSDGMVEISLNCGNAAKTLPLSVGAPVRIRPKKK